MMLPLLRQKNWFKRSMNQVPGTNSRIKKMRSLYLFLGSLFLVLASSFAAEPMHTLSVAVSEAHPKDAAFSAHFKHPATGEDLEYIFQVTANTGMNGLKNVKELKRNDLLQVDYFKLPDGTLKVEYMARIKMEGAPEGLERFNPADLLRNASSKK